MTNGNLLSLNMDARLSLNSFSNNTNKINRLKDVADSINAKDKKQEEIKSAARDFEAMLLSQMMNEMWKSVPENNLFGKSQEEDYFREMLTEEVAKEISLGQGLGIQDLVIKELEK